MIAKLAVMFRAPLSLLASISTRRFGTALRVLNLADALTTMWLVSKGAEELNPLMAALLNVSPLFFLFVKVLVGGLGAEALVFAGARRSLIGLCAFYAAVVAANTTWVFLG